MEEVVCAKAANGTIAETAAARRTILGFIYLQ
jgi:hypothetical protein